MKISRTIAPAPLKTAISAYIDGKSTHIEALKLDAVDRFESARDQSQGALSVTIDGLRHHRGKDLATFGLLGLAPAAASAAVGYSLAGMAGAAIGGLAGVAVSVLPATYFLQRAAKAPQWVPGDRTKLGEKSGPSPVAQPGPQKLRHLVDETRAANPEARQFLFLSGHGDRQEVAHMKIPAMGEAMRGSQLDATIVDACLLGQLEVLTHMAPWAGLIMVSPHKILAKGLELPEMLSPSNLAEGDLKNAVIAMAKEAKSTTPSFAVIDSDKFQDKLLPSLDNLGQALSQEDRSKLVSVLGKSLSPDTLFSARVDMGSFLSNLEAARIAPKETNEALTAFRETVPYQKNKHSFSFDLKAGRNDQSLPSGWRAFLDKADRNFKPLWG